MFSLLTNTNNDDILAVIIIAVIFLLIGLLAGLCSYFSYFSSELKRINCEIERTVGAERRYWIRRKRKLWLSLIPFVKYR